MTPMQSVMTPIAPASQPERYLILMTTERKVNAQPGGPPKHEVRAYVALGRRGNQ